MEERGGAADEEGEWRAWEYAAELENAAGGKEEEEAKLLGEGRRVCEGREKGCGCKPTPNGVEPAAKAC